MGWIRPRAECVDVPRVLNIAEGYEGGFCFGRKPQKLGVSLKPNDHEEFRFPRPAIEHC